MKKNIFQRYWPITVVLILWLLVQLWDGKDPLAGAGDQGGA